MKKTNVAILLIALSVSFCLGCYRNVSPDVSSGINHDNDFVRVFSKGGKAILLVTNPDLDNDKVDLYTRVVMIAKYLELSGWEMMGESHLTYSGMIFVLSSSNMLLCPEIKNKEVCNIKNRKPCGRYSIIHIK